MARQDNKSVLQNPRGIEHEQTTQLASYLSRHYNTYEVVPLREGRVQVYWESDSSQNNLSAFYDRVKAVVDVHETRQKKGQDRAYTEFKIIGGS